MRTQVALPGGNATLRVKSSLPFGISVGAPAQKAIASGANSFTAEIALAADRPPAPLMIDLATGAGTPLDLAATYSTESDPTDICPVDAS